MLISIFKTVTDNRNDTRIRKVLTVSAYSIVWEEYYNKIGVCQAVFANTEELRKEVLVGRFLGIAGVSNTLMYINNVRLTDTQIWAMGYDLKGIYRKKGLLNTARNAEVDVKQAILTAFTNAPISYVDNASTLVYQPANANIDDLDYKNVYEFVQGCLSLSGGGFRMRLVDAGASSGKVTIFARQGVDKSDTVRFAKALGNVHDITYTDNDDEWVNTVTVVGELADGTQVSETSTNRGTNDDVWEYVEDVRTSYKQRDETTTEYRAALKTRADQILAEQKREYEITVGNASASGLGTTFQLGDKVSVALPNGLGAATATVTGYKRVSESGTEKTELILDDLSVV